MCSVGSVSYSTDITLNFIILFLFNNYNNKIIIPMFKAGIKENDVWFQNIGLGSADVLQMRFPKINK